MRRIYLDYAATTPTDPEVTNFDYVRKGTRIMPFMHGGGRERKRRASSTENIPGIVGFGKAVEIAKDEMDEEAKRLTILRGKLIEGIFERIEHVRLNGHPTQRLPNPERTEDLPIVRVTEKVREIKTDLVVREFPL